MEANVKERLYRLVDGLPDGAVDTAEYFLESLSTSDDPVVRALMNAPIDDEPVTQEEEEAVRESWEDHKAGRVQSLDEIEKELGL
jgi:hypothetical protein